MRALWLACLFAVGAGCADRPSPELRVLITLEGLRADRLEVSGAARDLAPALAAASRRGRLAGGAITSSTEPLAALATVLTGLPADAHGFLGSGHPLRDRLGERFVTRAEELAARGFRTLAFVQDLPDGLGLDQGFEEFHVAPDAAAAVAALTERLAREEPRSPRFVWLHLRIDPDDAGASPFWPAAARRHLAPFAARDDELARRLSDHDEVAAYLGRRRGTPPWKAFRRAAYEASLANVDAALAPVLAEGPGPRLLVLGLGGVPVDESPSSSPAARFGEGALRAFALLVAGEAAPPDPALVSLAAVSELILRDAWPAPASRVAVTTGVPGELALVGPRATWVRAGGAPVAGLARPDGAPLAGPPPAEIARALAPLLARGTLARLEGGAGPSPGAASLELRVVGRPRDARRAALGVPVELELENLDADLLVDLGLPLKAGEADVELAGVGPLERAPLPRLPARDGAPWESPEDAAAPPWTVDVTRAVGGRVRVRVLSDGLARLRVVLSPPPVPAHDWAPRSHGTPPCSAWLGEDPGVARFEGAGLDVSFATAGVTPAVAVEVDGRVVPAGRMRWAGRRFHGAARRFLLTARDRLRLGLGTNAPGTLPPAAPDGEDGAPYRLSLLWPPTAPLAPPRPRAPLRLTHVPASD